MPRQQTAEQVKGDNAPTITIARRTLDPDISSGPELMVIKAATDAALRGP